MSSSPAVWEWILGIGLLLIILALALHTVSSLADYVVKAELVGPIHRLGP